MLDDLFTPSAGQVGLNCHTSQIFEPKDCRYPFAENCPLISKTSGFSLGVHECWISSGFNFDTVFSTSLNSSRYHQQQVQ